MVKIRLRRLGATKRPFYRVVVADSRSPRDGRFIEAIGRYQPMDEPSLVEIDADRALHWLAVGAQPTQQVRQLLKVAGVWERFEADRPKTAAKLVGAGPKPGARTAERWTQTAKDAEAARAAQAAAAAPPPPAPTEESQAAAAEAEAEAPAEEAPAADAPHEAVQAESEADAQAAEADASEEEAAGDESPAGGEA